MKKILLPIILVLICLGLFLPPAPIAYASSTSFTSSTSDGYFSWGDAVYATGRTAVSGTPYYTFTSNSIGQYKPLSLYNFYRSTVYFDTSSIPDGATVTVATLKLYGKADYSDTDFDITVQNGMPTYPSDPMVATDYDQSLYSGSGGTLTTAGWNTSGYNSITLNATGRGWVNKTGITKFMLRSSRDINANVPTDSERIQFWATEKGSGYEPTLDITYTATSSPTITANAASNIAQTTATLNGTISDDGGNTCEVRWGYGTTTQTAGNFANYDTVTAWGGSYTSGQNPYYDASSLIATTTYYYRFQAKNDVGTTTSNEITFDTLTTINEPSAFKGDPEALSIYLSWTKGSGASNTYIRYSTSTYPTAVGEGQLVASDSGNAYEHTGLTRGTTYYYSAWGESGGVYSASYITLLMTTSAATAAAGDMSTPDEPSRWFGVDYTNLSNMPFYFAINTMADNLGMPRDSLWIALALTFASVSAIVAFVLTGSMLVGIIVLMLSIIIGWATNIVPLWMLFMSMIVVIGLFMARRETA